MAPQIIPLIAIVGETGSGKSDLAMYLAKKFQGEIIAADSRTVYKGMDIGTAKPTKLELQTVRHHLIDVVEPGQKFSAAQFQKLAYKAINDIVKRGKLPILVGGTGLYIDCVIYSYDFKPDLPNNPQNPRHRLRSDRQTNNELRSNTLVLGLSVGHKELEDRLKKRAEAMIKQGLVSETKKLLGNYPSELEAFRAPAYKAFGKYLNDELNIEEAKSLFVQYDLNLAKRQRTWFKRNKSIHWINNREQAVELVTTYLNK